MSLFGRLTLLLLPAALSLSTGCTVGDSRLDLRRDMTMSMSGTTLDLAGLDFALAPGAIGAPCTQNTDCKSGTSPVCWSRNILDDPGNLPTPGGYCTAACTSDTDCPGGTCQTISAGRKYCLQKCIAANICRVDQQYACFILSSNSGYCYPSNRLGCNPTVGDGTCPGANPAAGCIRRTFEDQGECHTVCQLGRPCPVESGIQQHCVFINATVDVNGSPTRDRFQGLGCFANVAQPKGPLESCAYFDECIDGYQCALGASGDKKCHALCIIDATGSCPQGQTCRDVFFAGRGKPGLCF